MASKGNQRPSKNEGVTPGTVQRPKEPSEGDQPVRRKCWTFEVVRPSVDTYQLEEGAAVSGAPNGDRVEVLSTTQGRVGYAPTAEAAEMLRLAREVGNKRLQGSVLESGENIRATLCLELAEE